MGILSAIRYYPGILCIVHLPTNTALTLQHLAFQVYCTAISCLYFLHSMSVCFLLIYFLNCVCCWVSCLPACFATSLPACLPTCRFTACYSFLQFFHFFLLDYLLTYIYPRHNISCLPAVLVTSISAASFLPPPPHPPPQLMNYIDHVTGLIDDVTRAQGCLHEQSAVGGKNWAAGRRLKGVFFTVCMYLARSPP